MSTTEPEERRVSTDDLLQLLLDGRSVFVVAAADARRQLEVALRRALLAKPEVSWAQFSTRDELKLGPVGGIEFSSPLVATEAVRGRDLDAVVLTEAMGGEFVQAAIPALFGRRGNVYWWHPAP